MENDNIEEGIYNKILEEFMDEFGRMPDDNEMSALYRNHPSHIIAAWEVL
jgi:hypothetical protein